MARVIVDTNVVLSHLVDRDPEQGERATALFEDGARGEHELIVHQLVVTEAVYVLVRVYDIDVDEIAAIVRDLLEAPGVVPLNDLSWTTVRALWPERAPDFTDACLAALVRTGRFDSLATFDAGLTGQLRQLDLPTYWD